MFLLTGIICAFALGSLVFVPDGAEDDEINSSDTDGAGHDDPFVQSQTNYELPPFATASSDILWGTNADDLIDALEGNDQLNGYGGDDVLNGGEGADEIFGGSGKDTLPEITDFRSGQDRIDIVFDIKGGIDENPKIEFEKQANGTIHVMINGLPLVQIKAGLAINEDDLNLIFQSSG